MRTIAIMNNKGGVGKTVTAINLADILVHDYGQRVVLVDCDGQMDLTDQLLHDLDDDMPTLADLMQGMANSIWSENLQEVRPGLRILPGDEALYDLDLSNLKEGADAFQANALEDIRDCAIEDNDTDFLIFDCPPGFTTASTAALYAAEEVILPLKIDGFSMKGMQRLQSQVRRLYRHGHNIRIAGVLITEWRNTEVVRHGEQLLRSLNIPVFRQTIRRTEKMPEATLDRAAIREYSPGSAASQDYRAWVKELLGEKTSEKEVVWNGKTNL